MDKALYNWCSSLFCLIVPFLGLYVYNKRPKRHNHSYQTVDESVREQPAVVTGYKKLVPVLRGYRSPNRGSYWVGGELLANGIPTKQNNCGIHIVFDPSDPEWEKYDGKWYRVEGRGVCVVFEDTARIQHGRVIGKL